MLTSIVESVRRSQEETRAKREKTERETVKPPEELPPRLQISTLEDFESHRRGPYRIQILIGESLESFELDEIGPRYPYRTENAVNALCFRQALAASTWLDSVSGEFLDPAKSTRIDDLWRGAKRMPFMGREPIGNITFGAFLLGAHINGMTIRSKWHKQGRGLLTINIDVPRNWLRRFDSECNKRYRATMERKWLARCGIFD